MLRRCDLQTLIIQNIIRSDCVLGWFNKYEKGKGTNADGTWKPEDLLNGYVKETGTPTSSDNLKFPAIRYDLVEFTPLDDCCDGCGCYVDVSFSIHIDWRGKDWKDFNSGAITSLMDELQYHFTGKNCEEHIGCLSDDPDWKQMVCPINEESTPEEIEEHNDVRRVHAHKVKLYDSDYFSIGGDATSGGTGRNGTAGCNYTANLFFKGRFAPKPDA